MALIELVVAILIIALLAGTIYGLWGRGKKGQGKSTPAQAQDRARDVECQSNLNQVRMRIKMDTDTGEPPPPAIPADVASVSKCPPTQQPYSYDPQTGQVHCTTPGHESF
jgi:type II secretory pathway pseudopilin PulG